MNNNLTKLMENDRFATFVGIDLLEVQPGYAVAKMDITEKHLNGVDIIQGERFSPWRTLLLPPQLMLMGK